MKKIIILLGILMSFTSCKKEEVDVPIINEENCNCNTIINNYPFGQNDSGYYYQLNIVNNCSNDTSWIQVSNDVWWSHPIGDTICIN